MSRHVLRIQSPPLFPPFALEDISARGTISVAFDGHHLIKRYTDGQHRPDEEVCLEIPGDWDEARIRRQAERMLW